MLQIRQRPIRPFLLDASAAVTAISLTLALPPLSPWWIPAVGAAFAIVVVKQLYGGLGYNPFNPAMAGYAMLLIAFPVQMTRWNPTLGLAEHSLTLSQTLAYVFAAKLPGGVSMDALTMATPLDYMRTHLNLGQGVKEIQASSPIFGMVAGRNMELVSGAFLLGGLWLLYKKITSWHIPVTMLGTLGGLALLFWLYAPEHYAPPLFHLFGGAAMLGAFFIATDPVTTCTTPKGRLWYGAGCGALTYIIRNWGGYPDGVAFAVLLMNMAVPTIDYYTRPRVFGQGRGT
jgi:electron transport complex protein RnfD